MRKIKGFAAVEGVIVLGVILLMVGVGYVGWKALVKSDTASHSTSLTASKSAEVITTKADLEAAEKALGDLNFDDTQASQAEAQASL